MKKIFLPFIAALAFTACTGDENPVLNEAEGQSLEICISQPMTRAGADSYAVATEEERTVKTLDAYLFDNNEQLEKVYKNLVTEDWVPQSPTESKRVTLDGLKDKSARTVLLVANGAEVTSLVESAAPGAVTKSVFESLLTDAMSASLTCPLLMTAEASISAWTDQAPAVQAELRRVVARLDLKIYDPAEITGFSLRKAELLGASTLSYIFPNVDFAPCGKIQLTNAAPVAEDVERTDAFGTYTDQLYKALFYLYSAPASQMTLRLYGEQMLFGKGPAEVIYDIPLSKILPEGETDIERNTCYTLVVKDIEISGSGSFELNVDFDVEE